MSGVNAAHLTRMVLVRHGEAEGNRELRYLGDHDAPLTARGTAQAEQVAQASGGYGVRAIYSSPLSRALETAWAMGRVVGTSPRVEPELREVSYGAWEGLLHAEVAERDPDRLREWEADSTVAPPGGESLRDMAARVVACADRLAHAHGGECVTVVSHVGPVKALVCHVLRVEIDAARHMWLDPATITVIDWPLSPGRSGALRVFNSFAHLDGGVRWLP